jgi:hypothetical protein
MLEKILVDSSNENIVAGKQTEVKVSGIGDQR